ncbi:MAG: isoprenoid biosynthesis protein ElbB [Desulfobulbus sp.]|nr:MAG: isoprenoid biosynthesis protein ElbB [Desulfobulbus sp.]
METRTFAVILSGCGNQDGTEIHEATMTLWAIHNNDGEYQCFAPDIEQNHVLNHITGQEMPEQRNVLVESARIARGQVTNLKEFHSDSFDGLIIPGGLGAAKNLSTYAVDGAQCSVNKDVETAIKAMHTAGKPIGALCIAPVILARVLDYAELTIGQDEKVARDIALMGAQHRATLPEEIVIDTTRKIVTTPCYMFDARVDQIGRSAEKLVQAMLAFM